MVADPRPRYQLDDGTLHGDALTLADTTTISPEAVVGAALSPASDIYSLGVLLYRACTGRFPILALNPLTMAWRHVHDEPPRPRVIAPLLVGDVESVILRCLEKDPARRYPTMVDLKTALAPWMPSPGDVAVPRAPSPAVARRRAGPPAGGPPTEGPGDAGSTPRDGTPSIHEIDTLVAPPLPFQSLSGSYADGPSFSTATTSTSLGGGYELKRLAPIREADPSGDEGGPDINPQMVRGRADGDDKTLDADRGASAKDSSPWLGLRQLSQRVLGGPLSDHPLDADAPNASQPRGEEQ